MKRYINVLIRLFGAMLLVGVVQKLLFLVAYFGKTINLSLYELWGVFRYGMVLDVATAGYVVALPWLLGLVALVCGVRLSGVVCRTLLRGYLFVIAAVAALITTVDCGLYEHWGYRIDATLLPYLSSPADAMASMSLGDVCGGLTLFVALFVGALWLFWSVTRGAEIERVCGVLRRGGTAILWLLLGGFIFLGIRGGVSESTANVSKVYFSRTAFANHAAVNPVFSLLSSVGKVERYGEMYRLYSAEDEARLFYDAVTRDKERDLGRVVGGRVVRKGAEEPNVVIIIAEGFTRAIMDLDIDGHAVMPHMRRLAREGLDFSRVYASGSRTDKGVVSVLSGFPAQPKLSIMKIPSKSRNLPSLARSLGREGYDSYFYYGGDLDFMNMSSYLYSTGWDSLVWGDDISAKIRALDGDHSKAQWGWRDEAMSRLFADDVVALSESGDEPFLAAWLSLSSHKPFDVGRDMGFSDPMINSMAYSDAAVGRCIDILRGSAAWDNLLVVVVADHTYGGYGAAPYNDASKFHIPMVWTGGALSRRGSVGSYVSQYDLAATLLGALGVASDDFEFSRDVFARGYRGYGYYTFNDGFGVVSKGENIIYDARLGKLVKGDKSSSLAPLGGALLQHTHSAIEAL